MGCEEDCIRDNDSGDDYYKLKKKIYNIFWQIKLSDQTLFAQFFLMKNYNSIAKELKTGKVFRKGSWL